MKKLMLIGGLMIIAQGAEASKKFSISSLDFAHQGKIPKEFTCDGANKMPQFAWEHAPAKTVSFALICDDPDAPKPTTPWVHWVVYNIPGNKMSLDHVADRSEKLTDGTLQGANSWPHSGYDGPCPPKGHGIHHYHFTLYALDAMLKIKPGATKQELLKAMEGHILGKAEIVGTYERA